MSSTRVEDSFVNWGKYFRVSETRTYWRHMASPDIVNGEFNIHNIHQLHLNELLTINEHHMMCDFFMKRTWQPKGCTPEHARGCFEAYRYFRQTGKWQLHVE